jgi:PIN domain nuclease of toxin-antitoxin system
MLIDTHIFLWFQTKTGNLSAIEIRKIEAAYQSREICLSSISIWELALKANAKALEFHLPFNAWVKEALRGIKIINVDVDIALENINLPEYGHKDLADRFIIATARVLDIPLMTHDQKILAYAKKGHVRLV